MDKKNNLIRNNVIIDEFIKSFGGRGCLYDMEDMEYHLDWDMLMVVIKTIKDIDCPTNTVLYANKQVVLLSLASVDIGYVFDGVLEFIEWYKENN